MEILEKMEKILKEEELVKIYGKVTNVAGIVIEGIGPGVSIGSVCSIINENNEIIQAEVVGFKGNKILLMPFTDTKGLTPNCLIYASKGLTNIKVGKGLLGRVIDGLGQPIDGKGEISYEDSVTIYREPINPLKRKRITEHLDVGIKSINGILTIGKGQRMGILAGSGVGKSTLIGMMARYTKADVNVIGLIGERGREVKEFIEKDLGEEGLARSVVVAVTSDSSPLLRMRGAFVATSIAEYFREQGKHVLLMMDSITRFAMAQREIGLAIGEPPTTKGYTPSVFSTLPKLLERAGNSDSEGSLTAIYTVLVEGDDMNEPIADATRAILDGHIILSRQLAAQNHYPCIDILNSKSRVMNDVVSEEHKELANKLVSTYAVYKEAEDLINIGAYNKGSNPKIDFAISKIDAINDFLKQKIEESFELNETVKELKNILG
jgi:flagellum-specific ATP synthase